MTEPGWHDVLLTPAQFYECSGHQQWFLAKYILSLSKGDGWRWSVVDNHVRVATVEGSPETPFPEPPYIEYPHNTFMPLNPLAVCPRAGWDGVELLQDVDPETEVLIGS